MAGSITLFNIIPVPVTEPITTGLIIVPDAILPVDINIPKSIGVIISMVLTIVVRESMQRLYASLKLFTQIPIIIMVHMRRLMSDMDFFPKDDARFFNRPMTMHMKRISIPSTKAVLISYKTRLFIPSMSSLLLKMLSPFNVASKILSIVKLSERPPVISSAFSLSFAA